MTHLNRREVVMIGGGGGGKIQFIKIIYYKIIPPTQHHCFFRNLYTFFNILMKDTVLPHVPLPQSTPGRQQPDHN